MPVLPLKLPLIVILWLCALLVVGGYLRVHGVNDYYYNPDELSNIAIAKGDTVGDVLSYSRFETHPPYPAVLRHFLLKLSDDPRFLRGESAFFGLLCILIYYGIGTNAGGPLMGCIAAFLVTFSYGNILQSQVVRNYTMLAFFLGCAYWCYQRFMRTALPRYAIAYSLCGLLALMTHYSAIFLCFSIYAVSAIFMVRDKQWRSLQLWTLANLIIAAYFGFEYLTEIRHNAYEAMFEAALHVPGNPGFNSAGHRLLLFLCYVPLTAAYYLVYPASAQILFFFCALLLYLAHSHRRFFCETIFALLFGAALVGFALYPYGLIVGGRHAIWILPYIILPVSFLFAFALRFAHFILRKYTPDNKLIILCVMAIGLIAGFSICMSEDISTTILEHVLTNAEVKEQKQFISRLGPEDVIVAAELGVPYLLNDATHYYRTLVQAAPDTPYFIANIDNTHILYLQHPMINGHIWNLPELVELINTIVLFKNIHTVWIVNLNTDPLHDTLRCLEHEKKAVIFPPVTSQNDSATIKPRFVGLSWDMVRHQTACTENFY